MSDHVSKWLRSTAPSTVQQQSCPLSGASMKIRQQEEPTSSRLVICCPTVQMLLASDSVFQFANCAAGRSYLASCEVLLIHPQQ